MNIYDWIQVLFFITLLLSLTPLLGTYMANVFMGNQTFMHPILGWLEDFCYRVSGVDFKEEMSWGSYAKTLLLFNLFGFVTVFLLQIVQAFLPLNPQGFPAVSSDLAFNTAMSFTTNTNWQSYAGETTLSYLTQMLGLTVQNFLSASTGLATLMALIRGLIRKTSNTIGNFWADLVRSVVYLFLPLSIVLAVVLVGQGVIQSFSPYVEVTTFENAQQTIPLGPVASQIAIKQLGTNGGGFFNANSAHPFENPTAVTNFLEILAILLIPAAVVYTYGIMIGSKRHAWLLLFAMLFLWVMGVSISIYSEYLSQSDLGSLSCARRKRNTLWNHK